MCNLLTVFFFFLTSHGSLHQHYHTQIPIWSFQREQTHWRLIICCHWRNTVYSPGFIWCFDVWAVDGKILRVINFFREPTHSQNKGSSSFSRSHRGFNFHPATAQRLWLYSCKRASKYPQLRVRLIRWFVPLITKSTGFSFSLNFYVFCLIQTS